jgi:hypothetical protein
MGEEVVNTWFKGVQGGAATIDAALTQWFDTDCEYRSDEVLRTHRGKVRARGGGVTEVEVCDCKACA